MLDANLNHVPENCRAIHIMGICGTGMAAMAGMLQEQGFVISGSDENVYPPMSDFLAARNIEVMSGYSADNLLSHPDLVIVGNVIRATNPEAVALAEMNIPYVSMPQALAHFFLKDKSPLVVAGTHGKTTTSSLLATTLYHLGSDPGFMIGGIVEKFSANFRLGEGEYFVIEGDEYDTAFFNKVSKFLHYQPKYAIVTSVEFDHADIFADLKEIKDSFRKFISLIPSDGFVLVYGDDPVVKDVVADAVCPVYTYGTSSDCTYRLLDMKVAGLATRFTMAKNNKSMGEFNLALPGQHNALNCMAVIGLLDQLSFPSSSVSSAISLFSGVKRRQQVRGEVSGVMVVDDFAHHPTAVRETVKALKLAWPERRLLVVFEPRTNSSRRKVFQKQYESAFSQADMVIVRQHVPLSDIDINEQFSSSLLVDSLSGQGKEAYCFADTDSIIDFLITETLPGDVVAILSNGGFDDIHNRLLSALSGKHS